MTRTRFSEPTDPALDVAWTAAPANSTTITGYEVQYRVKVAEGETANAWTDYTVDDGNGAQTKTLPASTRSINLPDLTPGTTYEFQVRALTRLEGEGPWSDIGSGQANRAPNATSTPFNGGTFPVGSIATYAESGQGALGVFFGDAEGDTLTYAASSQHPALLGVSLSGAAGSATLTATLLNPGASTITFTASDPYGGQVTRTTTITGSPKTVSRSVAENSAAGTAVGDPVTGVPYDDGDDETNDALSYRLSGGPSTSENFEINSATGQISVKQGASLDYETENSYSGEVHYTVDGHAAVINVTISVTDLEAGKPGTPAVTRTQFSEPTNPALDVTWTAAPANGTTVTGYEVQYRVEVAEGETANAWTDYTVDDGNGAQTKTLPASTRSINLPDLTPGTTYEFQVRALTRLEGEGPWSDIGSGQANRAPNASSTPFNGGTFPVGTVATYAESGQGALGVFFGDAEGDTLTYAASSQHPALLGVSLSGAAGSATLTATLLNPGASTITFTASDPYGGQVTRTTTITGSPKTVSRSVAENSAAGTAVGDPVTGVPYDDGDDETNDALSYRLSGGPSTSENFEINSATGQISVKQGASLDYETENSYSGQVHYTVDGHAAVINVSISVTDVEAGKPDAPTLARTTFSQQSNPALDVTWTAPAANGTTITGYEVQYRVKVAQGETANAWTDYTVTDSGENPTKTLPVTPTSINLPDLAAGTTYEAQVRALTQLEGEGPWSDIGEGTANRPPRLATPGNTGLFLTLRWGDAATLRAISGEFVDDDSDTLTYSASAEHAGVLGVSIEGSAPTNLKMEVLNPATTTVTYGVSDGYGGYVSATLDVAGVADRLTGSELTRDIDENSPAGTAVGAPVVGTPYANETFSYTLTGAATSAFVIDSSSGQISVKQGATLDYETTTSYEGSVTWSVQGQEAEAQVTINVVDLEAAKPDTPTVTRTEFSEPSNPALDVTWTAPAANRTTITGYEARYRVEVPNGQTANAWTDHTVTGSDGNPTKTLPATTTSFNLPDLAAGTPYEAQVRALTSKEGPSPWSDIGEGRVNQPPQYAVYGGYYYWLENGPGPGLPVGDDWLSSPIELFYADPDGDELRWGVSSQYPGIGDVGDFRWEERPSDLPFLPDERTLRWTFEFYNPASLALTYGAHDGYGGWVQRTFTWVGIQRETRTIAENSAAGTTVGDPVAGTPYDDGDDETDDSLTYTLTGDAADAFVIDAASGQISVKQDADLDYETTNSYTGSVTWTVQGQTATANLTINVTDLEAGKPDAPTLTRTAFSKQSNPALDVTWTAPAANGLTITGYNAQYRKKVAEGETANAWTDYTITGANNQQTSTLPAATSIAIPDLEAGATYEVQVRALTSEEGEGPWSDIGEGRANRLPHHAAHHGGTTYYYLVNNNQPVGELWVGWPIEIYFADPDGDSLSWAVSSQYPGIGDVGEFQWKERPAEYPFLADEPTLRWTFLFYNPGTLELTYGVHDGYGGYTHRKFSWTGKQAETRDIAENSPAGTAVGDPVTGTPYDDGDDETDDALTYTLTGEAATSGAFVIDSATGQISVQEDANLDYETKASYTGSVTWTVQGQTATADLTINVTDVEAGKPDAPTLARTEFSEPSNPALDVEWAAPEANGLTISGYNAQYRKQVAEGETANAWTDHTTTDANDQQTTTLPASTTSITLADLEAGATYEVQVRAVTSEEGEGPWSDIGEGTANRPPNLTGWILVDYIGTWGREVVGDVGNVFADADGDTLTFAVSPTYPGVATVRVDGSTLYTTILNPAATSMTYGAHDGYGGYASRTRTVTGRGNVARSVFENSPAGTAVGDPVTGTPYDDGDDQTNDALSYSLSGEASTSGAFVIDSATGQISVKQGATLDRETKASYAGEVHWTVQGQAAVLSLTINVSDNNAVIASAPTVTRTRFSEPSSPALDVTWTAAEANGTTVTGYEVQYRKQVAAGDTPEAWTTYSYTDSNEVETTVLPTSTLTVSLANLEAGATYEVQVRAVSSEEGVGVWSDTGSGQANTPPAASALSLSDGTLVWKASADYDVSDKFEDADSDTLTYSASAAHPGVLTATITGSHADTLRVTALNPASSVVTYAASDAYGGYLARTVTITGTASVSRSIAENSAAGTAVGDAVAGTPHGTETLSYTLTGGAATSGAFEINSATGQISVKQGASLDYETKTSYTGQVNWTVQGQAAVVNVTISVTDVTGPETPAAPSVEAGASEPATSLDVSWTAPDDLGSAITGYRVRYRTAGPTDWTEHTVTGTATETTIESLDAATIYKVQVLAINAEGESDWSVSGTGVTGPVQLDAEREVPEDAQPGAPVGDPVTATDPDGHTLTYTVVADISGASGNSGRSLQQTSHFVIDPVTGQIRVAPDAHLDYETAHSHELTVRATHTVDDLPDGHIVNALITVTITVTDVEELVLTPTPPTPALELDPASREVAENAPGGTRVGAPVTARGGNGDPLTYSISGSGAFTIDAATGQIRVTSGAVLDHETTPSHTVTVSVTDSAASASADVTISVTDVDEPPARPDAPSVNASPAAPQTALDVTWTAPANTGPPLTGYSVRYRKQGEGWSAHAVSGTGTSATLSDLEPDTTYELQVAASNAEGTSAWSDSGTGSTRPTPELEPDSASREVAENAPGATPVGAPVTARGGNGDPLTYSISGSGAFTIDSASGQIRVATGAVLDYESTQSHTVTVNVTDGTANASAEVTITVTDVDEPPARPRRAGGEPVARRAPDRARRQLDGSGQHGAAPHRLRPALPEAGRAAVVGARLRGHGHLHHHSRPRARRYVRSAGGRIERRGHERLVRLRNGLDRTGERRRSSPSQRAPRGGRERACRHGRRCSDRRAGSERRSAHLLDFGLQHVHHRRGHGPDSRGQRRRAGSRGHAVVFGDRRRDGCHGYSPATAGRGRPRHHGDGDDPGDRRGRGAGPARGAIGRPVVELPDIRAGRDVDRAGHDRQAADHLVRHRVPGCGWRRLDRVEPRRFANQHDHHGTAGGHGVRGPHTRPQRRGPEPVVEPGRGFHGGAGPGARSTPPGDTRAAGVARAAGHAGHAGPAGHAGHAGPAGHAGHAGHAGPAGHAGHAGPAGHARPGGAARPAGHTRRTRRAARTRWAGHARSRGARHSAGARRAECAQPQHRAAFERWE